MRQLADRTNVVPQQKTSGAPGGRLTSLGTRGPSWSARLCLPKLSEDKRVLWVHAHDVNMQPDGVAELNKAFAQLGPYLTSKQTAALARRCSLHPDQVKVWFMAQRLRHGISWDYQDIVQICSALKPDHEEDEEFQDNRKVDKATSPQKRRRRAVISRRERKRTKRDDGRIAGQAETRTTGSEAQTSCDGAGLSKQKRVAKTKQIRSPRKNIHHDVPEVPLVVPEPQTQAATDAPATESQADPQDRKMTPVQSGLDWETKQPAGLEEPLSAAEAGKQTDLEKLKNILMAELSLDTTDNPTAGTGQEETRRTDGPELRPQLKMSQLMMLRRVFPHCQYPDAEQYRLLTEQVGLTRSHLGQWFRDLRYSLKKKKPHWMEEEEYKKVLANIKDKQHRALLSKKRARKVRRRLDDGAD